MRVPVHGHGKDNEHCGPACEVAPAIRASRREAIEEAAHWVCTMAMSVSNCHPVCAAKIALEMQRALLDKSEGEGG